MRRELRRVRDVHRAGPAADGRRRQLDADADEVLAWLYGGPTGESEDASEQSRRDLRAAASVRLTGLALGDGNRGAAARALDRALELDPSNMHVRKQHWALRDGHCALRTASPPATSASPR